MSELVLDDETLQDRRSQVSSPRSPPVPHLFVALECARPLAGSSRHSLANIDEVVIGRGSERSAARIHEGGVDKLIVRLCDARISARHARLYRREAAWEFQDLGSRNGSQVNGAEVVEPVTLRDGALIEVGHTLLIFRAGLATPAESIGDLESSELHATDRAFATLLPQIATSFATLLRIAKSNVPILLSGETGSGKELLARAIHAESGRSGELVAINCGALPHTLLEAQLFGHVKGAFSGATRDELGYVRSAQRGTLFLDEIGELPPASQVALLRVLQEQEVVPVGTTRPIAVDIRVVAATNAPIDQLVASGAFRSDLFARLSGFRFASLPLRERLEDLGLLLANLLSELAPSDAAQWKFDPAAARALFRYAWPRNVRELKQCLASATVLASAQQIELPHLPAEIAEPSETPGPARVETRGPVREPSQDSARPQDIRTDEALHSELVALFTACAGNVSEVARRMGKARTQVQRWMARFAIDPATFRASESSEDDATPEEPSD